MRLPLIVLLILATLAPTSAMASEWYRCRADGEVRRACCCPTEEEAQQAPDMPPGFESACCCDVDRIDARTSDLRARSDAAAIAAALVMTVETVSAMPATPAAVAIAVHASPAQPRGPPALFLRHGSLLL